MAIVFMNIKSPESVDLFGNQVGSLARSSSEWPCVAVCTTGNEIDEVFPLLRTVAAVNGVTLVRYSEVGTCKLSGLVIVARDWKVAVPREVSANVPVLLIHLCPALQKSCELEFSGDWEFTSNLWRGRRVTVDTAAPCVQSVPAGQVLLKANGLPVWVRRHQDDRMVDISFQPEPWILKEPRLFMHLNGQHFVRLLPFIEWCRKLSDWCEWHYPPLRASFIFDDPNLRSLTYGYIDFQQIQKDASERHYHVSFATVPLDCWVASESSIQLFRQHADRLSLLIHGNNHTFRELGGIRSIEQAMGLIREALHRIKRFEHRYGIDVDRVMVPPHGAFSVLSMKACSQLGFQAGCVSWGSVWSSNRDLPQLLLLGGALGSVVEGLPILPRFRFGSSTRNNALVCGYLNQPILPAGHHLDLARGLDGLREASDFINGLGDVRWERVSQIARRNYCWSVRNEVLRIRPMCREMDIRIPEGIRFVCVETEWMSDYDIISSKENDYPESSRLKTVGVERGAAWFEVVRPGRVTLVVRSNHTIEGTAYLGPFRRCGVLIRRLAAELRDRVVPFIGGNCL